MSELDDLPESVRESYEWFDTPPYPLVGWKQNLDVLRAELLRLAARVQELERENGELRAEADHEYDLATTAEAELDALKARIAAAPIQILPAPPDANGLVSRRVALLDMGKEG